MSPRGSHSARSHFPYSPCHPTRWAQCQGHSGFCLLGAGPFRNPAPSRPLWHPGGPSCHHRLSPRVRHATPLVGQHTCWAHQPDEPGRDLGVVGGPQVRRHRADSLSPPFYPSTTHPTAQGLQQLGRQLDLGMIPESLLASHQMAPRRSEGFVWWWPRRSLLGDLEWTLAPPSLRSTPRGP